MLLAVDLLGKIADADLRTFAQGDKPEAPRSVIIEVKATPFDLGAERLSRGWISRRPFAVGADSSEKFREDQTMDKLEKDLMALGLGQDLIRLDTASAFVVSALPAQLRAVSSLPLVGLIRPNRTHSRPAVELLR